MKLKGWQLMGLASIFSCLSGCGAAAMNKDVTKFKWYGVATDFAKQKRPKNPIDHI